MIKSKNFILAVLIIVLLGIISLAIGGFLIKTEGNEKDECVEMPVRYTETALKVQGDAYISDELELLGTNISKFGVRLRKKGKVKYRIGFCNNTNKDYVYNGIATGKVTCFDAYNEMKACDDVKIDVNVVVDDNPLKKKELLSGLQCGEIAIEMENVNNSLNNETIVRFSDYYLEFLEN